MRYLYGDLTEFPQQENTLELLKRFITMAVDVLKLDQARGASLQVIEDDREYLGESIGDISDFIKVTCGTMQTCVAGRTEGDVVYVTAKAAEDNFRGFVAEAQARLAAKVEQRIQQTQMDIDGLSRQILSSLKAFFMSSGVPVSRNTLRCTLQDQTYQAQAEILDVTGIRCAYRLNTAASDFFGSVKRFSDLAPGKLEFPVGTKKAWLKRDPVKDTMRIDDAALTSILDEDDFCEFKLGKRGGNNLEGLLFRSSKRPGVPLQAFRVDAAGNTEPIPADVAEAVDVEKLSFFAQQLFPHMIALYRTRGDLLSITIEGTDVVQGSLLVDLVRRLVAFLAPTVREIDLRSPAKGELCLKIENESGRREEIYIPKSDLVRKVLELPAPLRPLFAPLGLETGVSPEKRVVPV